MLARTLPDLSHHSLGLGYLCRCYLRGGGWLSWYVADRSDDLDLIPPAPVFGVPSLDPGECRSPVTSLVGVAKNPDRLDLGLRLRAYDGVTKREITSHPTRHGLTRDADVLGRRRAGVAGTQRLENERLNLWRQLGWSCHQAASLIVWW